MRYQECLKCRTEIQEMLSKIIYVLWISSIFFMFCENITPPPRHPRPNTKENKSGPVLIGILYTHGYQERERESFGKHVGILCDLLIVLPVKLNWLILKLLSQSYPSYTSTLPRNKTGQSSRKCGKYFLQNHYYSIRAFLKENTLHSSITFSVVF